MGWQQERGVAVLFDEDGSALRVVRSEHTKIVEVSSGASRCSSRTSTCNLGEHPDVVECCVHETFRCNRCQQIHDWECGGADDAPGLCDDCWSVFFGADPHLPERIMKFDPKPADEHWLLVQTAVAHALSWQESTSYWCDEHRRASSARRRRDYAREASNAHEASLEAWVAALRSLLEAIRR